MTTYLETESDPDPDLVKAIRADFGSVHCAVLSLFMSVTGGNDWSAYQETVKEIGPHYNYLYLFFIAFFTVAFLNVVTGVFAEKAMALAVPTIDEIAATRTDDELMYARELLALLNKVLGVDGTRTINNPAFDVFLAHPDVVKFLHVRGLEPLSARRFFKLLLEIHRTDAINFATFVSSCVKL